MKQKEKIIKKIFSWLLIAAFVSTMIPSVSFADVTSFSSIKYDKLTTDFWLSDSLHQNSYLTELWNWNAVNWLSALPTDLIVNSLTSLVNSRNSINLDSLRTLINTYISSISTRITKIDTMTTYMKSDADWWIWYLQECVDDITKKFTTNTYADYTKWWVYCSNSQFFKDATVARTKLLQKQSTYLWLQLLISSKTTNLSEISEVNWWWINIKASTGGLNVDWNMKITKEDAHIELNDATDAGSDWAIRANDENFEIYEPEDSNKVQFKITDWDMVQLMPDWVTALTAKKSWNVWIWYIKPSKKFVVWDWTNEKFTVDASWNVDTVWTLTINWTTTLWDATTDQTTVEWNLDVNNWLDVISW